MSCDLLESGRPAPDPSGDSSGAGVIAILLSNPSSPATWGKDSPSSDSVFLLSVEPLL